MACLNNVTCTCKAVSKVAEIAFEYRCPLMLATIVTTAAISPVTGLQLFGAYIVATLSSAGVRLTLNSRITDDSGLESVKQRMRSACATFRAGKGMIIALTSQETKLWNKYIQTEEFTREFSVQEQGVFHLLDSLQTRARADLGELGSRSRS